MVKVAIFASGSGTNFENIMQRVTAGELPNIEVTALYTDRVEAECIQRAQQFDLDVHITVLKDYDSKADYEQAILSSYNLRELNGLF